MLTQQQRLRASRRSTTPQTVAAPLKGWNTRDPFEAMDPLNAILLDNWFPDFAGLITRNGSTNFVTGLSTSPVKTLAEFRVSAIDQFLAASGGGIYEISGGTGTLVKSGFGSDIWQTAAFNSHQFWANGTDPAQIYDGTVMSATGFVGANMAEMTGVGVFNNRVYFWTGNDPSFWYGPVLGISGALSNFPLGAVSQAGGNLMAVEILSYDGGTGIDDYTCFFMSSGEVLLYSGTDPSNPNNWALVGRYLIPPPVAMRSVARYGGDIYITTANDHQQLSKLFISLKLGQTPARTEASGAVKIAYAAGSALPGWQAMYYPAGTRMMYNIPNVDGTFSQHIFNTSTQAWCRFQNMNAHCWGLYQNNLYFGADNGDVIHADTGSSDNGSPVIAQAQQAWQQFETPLIKRVALVRPVVQSNGVADFSFSFGFDYQPANIQIPASTIDVANALVWGVTAWGAPRRWGGIGVTDPRWHIGGGQGAAIGLALAANTQVQATWIRTDFMLEAGSAL